MITDDVQARRVAAEAAVAAAALDQRERAMKAWASVRGDVVISSTPGRERVWGFVARKRTQRPKREVLERALSKGGRVDLDALYPAKTITRFEKHYPVVVEETASDAGLMNALAQSVAQRSSPDRDSFAAPDQGTNE